MSQRRKDPDAASSGTGLEQRYLTVKQCASYVGRTEAAIYHLVALARIPHRRLPGKRLVFDRVAIDKWIAESSGISASDVHRASVGSAS